MWFRLKRSLPLVAMVFFASNAFGEDRFEETAVQALIDCGPWPLNHAISRSYCKYPVIDKTKLAAIESGRLRLLNSCLSCASGACVAKSRADMASYDFYTCRILFRSPLSLGFVANVGRPSGNLKRGTKNDFYTEPFTAKLRYTIDFDGKVIDLEILDVDAEVNKADLKALIRLGAKSIRYPPLVVRGVAHQITEIESRIMLR
jgi:hypothetical protein